MKDRLIELIDKAKEEYANDVTDHNETEYIVETLLDDGWMRPPCKAGDTVYAIYDKKVYEAVAEQVTVVCHISGTKIIKVKAEFDVEDWFYNDGRKTKYGICGYYQENVFLTREEAVKALQRRREDEGK